MQRHDLAEDLYERLTGDIEADDDTDLPGEAEAHQSRNFLIHVAALTATKTGDGLADPKLVLAWLMGALGAPPGLVGLLVPVRESLALLPQLFTARYVRALPRRKWVWAVGSLVQGLAVLAMAATALGLKGAAAGWTIVALLALFALARSLCSVSYKDVLGKTVAIQARGTAPGTAKGVAAVMVLAFGAALSFGLLPLSVPVIATALAVAGGLWLAAGLGFTAIEEAAQAKATMKSASGVAATQFALLRDDPQLLRFIVTRGFLIATALAPPFMLALAGSQKEHNIADLGPFVIATSLAGAVSAYVWGRLSDRSSRRVLMYAGFLGAVACTAAGVTGTLAPDLVRAGYVMPVILFVLVIAYSGVRMGRSTHLVDMAPPDARASYTALSNTAIGVFLVAGGGFGLVAEAFGNAFVLMVFAVMCLVAAALAYTLHEVQDPEERATD